MAGADVKLSLLKTGAILAVVVALATLLAYAMPLLGLPARVQVVENRVTTAERDVGLIRSERAQDRELLIRIDENVKALKEARK